MKMLCLCGEIFFFYKIDYVFGSSVFVCCSIEQESSISVPKQDNPVGELQELTQKKLLPLPTYEFEMTQGPPSVREFTCTIRLLKLTQTGKFICTMMIQNLPTLQQFMKRCQSS